MGAVSFSSSYNHFLAAKPGDGPNSMDGDPAFQRLAEGVWEAIQNFIKEGPSPLNIEMIMEAVKALSVYFTNNIPSKENNPLAFAVYTDLSQTLYGTTTLLQACDTFGQPGMAAAIQQIEQLNNPFGTLASQGDPGTGFEADLNAVASCNSDEARIYVKGDNTWQDFQNLMSDLSKDNPEKIAADIVNLVNDLKADKVQDGYLTNLLNFFQTPISLSSGLNLLTAAQNYSTDPSAFEAALKAVGVGSIYNLVYVSFTEEEFPFSPPA